MRVLRLWAVLLGSLLLTPPAFAQTNTSFALSNPDNPAGQWLTASGDAVVQISPCGSDLCGRITGLVYGMNDQAPRTWTGAPQCGLTIFRTTPQTDDSGHTAWTGTILDPRDGSTYGAKIEVDSPGQLELRGYVGLPLFGESQTWRPYTGTTPADCHLVPAG